MTDTFVDRLSEYLDGELSPAERASIEAHLDCCENCRRTLGELRHVVARAGSLQDSAPDRDLWADVAARIGAPPQARASMFKRVLTSRMSFTLPQLAAASLALMVLSGGLVWMAKSGDPRADFQPLSADVHREQAATPQSYDEAVAQLEKALRSERVNLGPDRVRLLDEDIAAADRTIAECRQRLRADPRSAELQSQLAAAEQRKLSLLRAALSEAVRRDR
jgi:predicted anti-sigma-YlaC factor YlaD